MQLTKLKVKPSSYKKNKTTILKKQIMKSILPICLSLIMASFSIAQTQDSLKIEDIPNTKSLQDSLKIENTSSTPKIQDSLEIKNTLKIQKLQAKDLKNYNWEEEANLLQVPEKHKEADEVILKDKTIIDFQYDDQNSLEEYYVSHTIKFVNSDASIDENNKIYLPFSPSVEVIDQKARVITPDGEVINMQEGDIKEATKEERTFRYFALKGLVKGAQVESFFKLRKLAPEYDGKIEVLQEEVPKYNTEFDIIAPENLILISKSYNDLPNLEKVEIEDSIENKFFHLSQTWDYLKPLKEEENAYRLPHTKKIIYKIDKNLLSPRTDIVSYDKIAKGLYENVDIVPDKKLSKTIQKFLKTAKLNKASKSPGKSLVALENYLKQNFSVIEQNDVELQDIPTILKNKVASKIGMMKLYCAVLNYLNINHQIVLVNNRDRHKFDKDFEAYNFLVNYLLYFPDIDQYLAPSSPFHKLGVVPYLWTNTYALFIEPVKLGNFKTAKSNIKFIEPLSSFDSSDEMFVEVSSSDGFKNLDINYNKTATGYYAQIWQPLYDFVDEEQRKELDESQVKFLTEDLEITNIETENEGMTDFGVKPFKFKSTFKTKAFMERAGEKILFKIGELIGPQVEMYQVGERKLPVESPFNRRYYRELKLNVPEGFTVKNLEELEFDEVYEEKGEVVAKFVSNYTFEDNTVKVMIEETYDKIDWSVDLFEEYRRIINAAADFNKVVLYLEK